MPRTDLRSSGAAHPGPDGQPPAPPVHATSRFERGLVALAVVVVPFQEHVSPTAGASISWIVFAVVGVLVVLRRPGDVFRVAGHRAMLPVYAFLAITFLMELPHPQPSWQNWWSTVQMVAGGVLVASICRDRRALLAVMRAILIAGAVLAVLFLVTSYGPLRQDTNSTFAQVSHLRKQVTADTPLGSDLNGYSFLSAEGAAVAAAFAVSAKARQQRLFFIGLSFVCFLGVSLSLSRAGMIIAIVSTLIVLVACRRRATSTLPTVALLLAFFLLIVPNAVFARYSTGGPNQVDPRVELYQKAWHTVPEFALFGVGSGNYWRDWGFTHHFADRRDITHPQYVHNSFLQIWINWGILGLASFVYAIWRLFRSLSRRIDVVTLCIRAVATAALIDLFFTHVFYGKENSFVLGMIVADQIWIAPTLRTTGARVREGLTPSSLRPGRRAVADAPAPSPQGS